jgi:predicted nucleotidyltransferase
MIQDEYKELVFKFARHASADGVANIILFGSVAKGEADKRSDIDLLLVLDTYSNDYDALEAKTRVSELAFNLEKEYGKNIQLIFTNKSFEGLDNHFIEAVLKEGIILFARSPSITVNGLELEHYLLVTFSLANLNPSNKMKIKRILYGQKTRKLIKNKSYESEKLGIVEKLQGLRVGAGVITIPQKNIQNFKEELSKFKVTFKEIDLWLPSDSIKKLRS